MEATSAGLDAVRRIHPAHAEAARALVGALGVDRAREVVEAMQTLAAVMDGLEHR